MILDRHYQHRPIQEKSFLHYDILQHSKHIIFQLVDGKLHLVPWKQQLLSLMLMIHRTKRISNNADMTCYNIPATRFL